jgi:ubiquinone/menaquinone biosynthesis C-methylase UbiE
VPADVYTEGYYRENCMGYEAWGASGGSAIDPLYPGYARLAPVREGDVLVDLGSGRGEMLVAALECGAARAIGVEYSGAAVDLAHETLAAHELGALAHVHHGDVREVPVGDGEASLVTMLDVVEHLTPAELRAALREAHRILRPGGTLFIHTMPNRTIYDVTYRLQRLALPTRMRRWPKDPRLPLEKVMHVNEMTVGRLRRALRGGGFGGADVWLGEWIHAAFVPDERARKLYHRLAARRLTQRLGRADLWARAVRSHDG